MEENNIIKNADRDYPMRSGAQEQSAVIEGFLDYEFERLGFNPVGSASVTLDNSSLLFNLDTPALVHAPNSNFSRDQDSNVTATDFFNLNTPASHPIISQPPSVVVLPECLEPRYAAPEPVVKKRKVSISICKTPPSINGQQEPPSKRGRPQKSDNEDNTDPTLLRKRTYARKYQRNQKAEFKVTKKSLHLICSALKDIESKIPQYARILEAMEKQSPGIKEIIRKNCN